MHSLVSPSPLFILSFSQLSHSHLTQLRLSRTFITQIISMVGDNTVEVAGGDELKGFDPIQVALMQEECILVDSNDKVIGHDSKKNCMLTILIYQCFTFYYVLLYILLFAIEFISIFYFIFITFIFILQYTFKKEILIKMYSLLYINNIFNYLITYLHKII